MATGNVLVTVVDVGQGQCTFVEIYDDAKPTPKLLHALLFDCGSDKKSLETDKNLNYVAAQALKLDKAGFDCIFFSHSDKDHISLTKQLLDKIWETKKPVVKEVIYGGDWTKYTKNKFNILDYIVDEGICEDAQVSGLASNFSNYNSDDEQFQGNLWQSTNEEVVVYAVAGNVMSDDPDWDDEDLDVVGKNAEALNRVSLIAGLFYKDDAAYVICGDATNVTMAACNTLFSDDTLAFHNNIMTTLPHHGSRATGFAVKSGATASKTAVKTVKTFAANMNSEILTVSSYAKHSHPSLQLINCFVPVNKSPVVQDARFVEKNAHRISANIDIDLGTSSGFRIARQVDYSFESQINTFSTYYFDGTKTFGYEIGGTKATKTKGVQKTAGAINKFACWQFTTLPSSTATLAGYADLASAKFTENPALLGRTAATAAAKPPPAPPETVSETPRNNPRAPVSAATKRPVLNGLKHFR